MQERTPRVQGAHYIAIFLANIFHFFRVLRFTFWLTIGGGSAGKNFDEYVVKTVLENELEKYAILVCRSLKKQTSLSLQ